MTAEALKSLNLPVQESDLLYVESGLEWLRDNTTLDVALDDTESIRDLPSGAKLFLIKFCEVAKKDVTVASESVGPMSQTFFGDSGDKQIRSLARQFLKQYLKPTVQFIPCQRRWN